MNYKCRGNEREDREIFLFFLQMKEKLLFKRRYNKDCHVICVFHIKKPNPDTYQKLILGEQ